MEAGLGGYYLLDAKCRSNTFAGKRVEAVTPDDLRTYAEAFEHAEIETALKLTV